MLSVGKPFLCAVADLLVLARGIDCLWIDGKLLASLNTFEILVINLLHMSAAMFLLPVFWYVT